VVGEHGAKVTGVQTAWYISRNHYSKVLKDALSHLPVISPSISPSPTIQLVANLLVSDLPTHDFVPVFLIFAMGTAHASAIAF
jgi:hypothetical protein